MLLSLVSKRTLCDDSRDAYGFAVRPQHIHRYREYASIYKEEEEERLKKWNEFLEQRVEYTNENGSRNDSTEECPVISEGTEEGPDNACGERVLATDNEASNVQNEKICEVHTWGEVRESLSIIQCLMGVQLKKRKALNDGNMQEEHHGRRLIGSVRNPLENGDVCQDVGNAALDYAGLVETDKVPPDILSPLRKELEYLVQGGVPKDLRGEVWQAFVGVRTRRVESYYQDLLDTEIGIKDGNEPGGGYMEQNGKKRRDVPEKLKKQIEKAMNFFAGLLLLMMPEENAFWSLVGIMDDYFEGYFSEEMIESQVDQLVFEDLVREKFPKLVNHLDYLGVEVAWVSGPWFLTIFANMLPWESVLRVWDVLLFEGSRVMLFRTALALMDLYAPAVVTAKDAGDAVTLLQALAGSTFDSSQLVLTACVGFVSITEEKLEELRKKHRPAVIAAAEEKAQGLLDKNSKGLANKLYSFKHASESIAKENKNKAVPAREKGRGGTPNQVPNSNISEEENFVPDLQEQVTWLKAELCRLLEERRSAMVRAEELEAALIERVKEDNRQKLYIRIEKLEKEVADLRQALEEKNLEEDAILQATMRAEEQEVVSGAASEHDAYAALRRAMKALQEKYCETEKRAVMAESMLAATLEYESGQSRAASSPRRADSPVKRTAGLLSFGLGWRDRNKAA